MSVFVKQTEDGRWTVLGLDDDGVTHIFGAYDVKEAAYCMLAALTCEDDE